MEDWVYFALLSAVSAGFYSFLSKVSAQYRHHASQATMYTMLAGAALSGIYLLYTRPRLDSLMLIIGLALLNILAYATTGMTRIDALKHIDATIYFPIYKLGSSLLAIPIGVLFFSDVISINELIGIAIGMLAPLLLFSKAEHARQNDLRKGLVLTGVGVLTILVGISVSKIIRFYDLDMSLYLFLTFLFGVIYSRIYYLKTKHREHLTKHVIKVGLLSGVLLFCNFFLFLKAVSGDLGVVYVINSFSVVISVLLSVLFYKEHFDFKKGLALGLTLLSLIFLS